MPVYKQKYYTAKMRADGWYALCGEILCCPNERGSTATFGAHGWLPQHWSISRVFVHQVITPGCDRYDTAVAIHMAAAMGGDPSELWLQLVTELTKGHDNAAG